LADYNKAGRPASVLEITVDAPSQECFP